MAHAELAQVGLGDLVEGEAQGGGEDGEVPEDVAQLFGDARAVERALVEEGFLDDLLDLSGLAAEADHGHSQGLAEVEPRAERAAGLGLVGDEVHHAAPVMVASSASRLRRSTLVSQSVAGQTPIFSRAAR